MCQKESWGAIFATTEAHSTQRDQPPRMHGPGLNMAVMMMAFKLANAVPVVLLEKPSSHQRLHLWIQHLYGCPRCLAHHLHQLRKVHIPHLSQMQPVLAVSSCS